MIVKFEYSEKYVNLDNLTYYQFELGNPVSFMYSCIGEEATQIMSLTIRYDINHWEEFEDLVRENLEKAMEDFETALKNGDKYFEFPEL